MPAQDICTPPQVSIHAFRGEGDMVRDAVQTLWQVSIHAFRGEGDFSTNPSGAPLWRFQSTPSGGKATSAGLCLRSDRQVSIHAFRGEGDVTGDCFIAVVSPSFNPRLPGGRRRRHCAAAVSDDRVSNHAFRGEGDPAPRRLGRESVRFNPRLPGGRRPEQLMSFSA